MLMDTSSLRKNCLDKKIFFSVVFNELILKDVLKCIHLSKVQKFLKLHFLHLSVAFGQHMEMVKFLVSTIINISPCLLLQVCL